MEYRKGEIMKYNFNDKTEDGLTPMALALTEKALTMGKVQTENPVNIEQWDLDHIFLKVDGVLYIIRTWNVHQTAKTIVVRWSLSCNHTELCSSVTTTFRIADFEETDKGQEPAKDDGFTKCITDGIAEQMLNAIEKKVKEQVGDIPDGEEPAGMGDIHIEIKEIKD